MSRIDGIIAKLAPNGVCQVALWEVAEYSPTRVDAGGLDETNFVGVDNLVADKGGRVNASYPPNTARLTAYEPGDILLGNIRPYLKKVWLATNAGGCSGDVLAIRIMRKHRESLDPSFLYYLLSSDGFFAYDTQHAKGAKMPRGDKEAILDFRIPVPPLAVQCEIVSILDTMQKLETELETELEARRQQYDHYSSMLLGESSGAIRRAALGDVLRLIIDHRGKTPKKLGGDWTATGHRVVSALNMKNGVVDDNDHHYIDDELYTKWMRMPLEVGDVLLTSEAPLGAVAFVDTPVDWALGQRLFGLRPDTEVLDGRYLYHQLRAGNTRTDLLGRATGSTVSGIRQSELVKIMLDLPDLAEQCRIAAVLDKFETLVNDLSVGLPAELRARRKQYEYYRDRLLTFKELAA